MYSKSVTSYFELDTVPMVCRGVVIHRAVSRNGVSSKKPLVGVLSRSPLGGFLFIKKYRDVKQKGVTYTSKEVQDI